MIEKLSKQQYGFRKRRSCVLQLLDFLNNVYTHIDDKKKNVEVIYLDLKKAFDSVNHAKLLEKLKNNFGVSNPLLKIIANYLKCRRQSVGIDGSISNFLHAYSGIPQGSLLGPLLFLVYINDLPDYIQRCLPYIMADDTKLLSLSRSSTEEVNEDLARLTVWSQDNFIEFNSKKTKHQCFSGDLSTITLDGVPVVVTNTHKDLGVYISDELK